MALSKTQAQPKACFPTTPACLPRRQQIRDRFRITPRLSQPDAQYCKPVWVFEGLLYRAVPGDGEKTLCFNCLMALTEEKEKEEEETGSNTYLRWLFRFLWKKKELYNFVTHNWRVYLIILCSRPGNNAVVSTYSSLKWTKCNSPEKAQPCRRCSEPKSCRFPQWKWKASNIYFPFSPPPDTRGRWTGGGSNFILRAWPLFSREMLTS